MIHIRPLNMCVDHKRLPAKPLVCINPHGEVVLRNWNHTLVRDLSLPHYTFEVAVTIDLGEALGSCVARTTVGAPFATRSCGSPHEDHKNEDVCIAHTLLLREHHGLLVESCAQDAIFNPVRNTYRTPDIVLLNRGQLVEVCSRATHELLAPKARRHLSLFMEDGAAREERMWEKYMVEKRQGDGISFIVNVVCGNQFTGEAVELACLNNKPLDLEYVRYIRAITRQHLHSWFVDLELTPSFKEEQERQQQQACASSDSLLLFPFPSSPTSSKKTASIDHYVGQTVFFVKDLATQQLSKPAEPWTVVALCGKKSGSDRLTLRGRKGLYLTNVPVRNVRLLQHK